MVAKEGRSQERQDKDVQKGGGRQEDLQFTGQPVFKF
jgi:hypothetical protein